MAWRFAVRYDRERPPEIRPLRTWTVSEKELHELFDENEDGEEENGIGSQGGFVFAGLISRVGYEEVAGRRVSSIDWDTSRLHPTIIGEHSCGLDSDEEINQLHAELTAAADAAKRARQMPAWMIPTIRFRGARCQSPNRENNNMVLGDRHQKPDDGGGGPPLPLFADQILVA